MGKKKIIPEYYELLDTCFSEEDQKMINEMVLNSRLNVESFVEHVLNGINKISVDGKRFIGFVSDEDKDYLAFVESQKYFYDFQIDTLTDKENYHCTIRFNNIDPMRNVYAVGYQITNKQVEYFKKVGKAPLVKGNETAEYKEWEKSHE